MNGSNRGILTVSAAGEDINENQIWCRNVREYMGFGSVVGSDEYVMAMVYFVLWHP